MTRLWTAPAVAGVVAAVLTAWLVRAVLVVVVQGVGADVVTVPSLLLLYAAGPAVLCALPLVLLARAVLARAGRGVLVHAVLGLVGGVLVGVVQTAVLLSRAPWQLPVTVLRDLVLLPALAGLAGGVVAGLVRRRQPGDTPVRP